MRAKRGFTLLEMMVTVAIIAVLAALAYPVLTRQRPRANLLGAHTELFALLRGARQNALATGQDTIVLFFPNQANTAKGTGRVVVVQTPATAMFGVAATFPTFDAAARISGDNLLGDLSFPPGITIGLGGAPAPTLRPPYANPLMPVGACTFCGGPPDGRGAIVFDYRGRARFYNAVGNALPVFGGTVALQALPEFTGYRMLVINAATGSVVALNG